jgi:hypothetical protein
LSTQGWPGLAESFDLAYDRSAKNDWPKFLRTRLASILPVKVIVAFMLLVLLT